MVDGQPTLLPEVAVAQVDADVGCEEMERVDADIHIGERQVVGIQTFHPRHIAVIVSQRTILPIHAP